MSYSIGIMYLVAAVFAGLGVALLLALLHPVSEKKVYAFRMGGVMALALGLVLFASATAMWRWSMAT